MRKLSQDSCSPGQDSDQAPLEYISRVLQLNQPAQCLDFLFVNLRRSYNLTLRLLFLFFVIKV
jgi:hypothetical protein